MQFFCCSCCCFFIYAFPTWTLKLLWQGCSLLAFVLDQLLPVCQTVGDKDCPALARVFLASIASCLHSPEAQATLVSEVKAALQRALALPESAEKHSRVQALMAIISTIIEACPTPGHIRNQVCWEASISACWHRSLIWLYDLKSLSFSSRFTGKGK